VRALPAAVFDALPDEGLSKTLAAALAAFGPVPCFISNTPTYKIWLSPLRRTLT
jgi:hypothetical protein